MRRIWADIPRAALGRPAARSRHGRRHVETHAAAQMLHHQDWTFVRDAHLLQVRAILLCKGMTRSRRVTRLSDFRQSGFTLARDLRDVDWFTNPSLLDRAIRC